MTDALDTYAEWLHAMLPRSPLLVACVPGFPALELAERMWPAEGSPGHISASSLRTVAAARELVSAASLRSYLSAFLWLSGSRPQTQDALLKFVEESTCTILLMHHTTDHVSETLRSRCFSTVLPPPTHEMFEWVLKEHGVPAARIDDLANPYFGTLEDAIQECAVDRGPVDEFLDALVLRDPVRVFTASRGFEASHCRVLAMTLRTHLSTGQSRVSRLHLPPDLLEDWAVALVRVPSAISVRWGAMEVLNR